MVDFQIPIIILTAVQEPGPGVQAAAAGKIQCLNFQELISIGNIFSTVVE